MKTETIRQVLLETPEYIDITVDEIFEYGQLICFHRKYNIGHYHKLTPEDLLEVIKRKDVISFPVYMYDHSGISISINKNS